MPDFDLVHAALVFEESRSMFGPPALHVLLPYGCVSCHLIRSESVRHGKEKYGWNVCWEGSRPRCSPAAGIFVLVGIRRDASKSSFKLGHYIFVASSDPLGYRT